MKSNIDVLNMGIVTVTKVTVTKPKENNAKFSYRSPFKRKNNKKLLLYTLHMRNTA